MIKINNVIKNLRGSVVRVLIVLLMLFSTTYGWFPAKLSQGEMMTSGNLERIVKDIVEGAGERNYLSYNNLEKTADYIFDQFMDLGYEVKSVPYRANNQMFKNIVAEMPSESEEIVIVGAHYDSCFNPGADDNASGIAGLIEIARLLKSSKTKKKIRFVAFVNEEPPFFMTEFMGSRVYAKSVKQAGEKIKGAIILEMIGFYSDKPNSQRYFPLMGVLRPNKANFIAVVGNLRSRELVRKVTSYFRDNSEFPIESVVAPGFIPGINFSDHWSFWKEGFPAVMITDTAYLRNRHYHQPTDLPETLNYAKMTQVIYGLRDAIIKLDENI